MNGSRYATARFIARALLTTCGRNIFPDAEEVADDLHPLHQRPLDDVERPPGRGSRLLGVLLDEVDDSVHERMREPLLHRRLAPGEIELALGRTAGDRPGPVHQPLRRVGAAVEEHALDALQEIGLDVLVHRQLARVHDAHAEPGADRVVEERGVHRLADGVVPAEGEGEVGDAARHERTRTALLEGAGWPR